MPLIERYILRRVATVFVVTLTALVGTVWITQVLRELDLVTAKGQTIWLFFVVTLLALPSILQIVAPIAFMVAVVVALRSLNGDSELAVIAASGASGKAVNRPVLVLATIVFLAVALLHHVVSPAGLGALRVLITKVRADIIATVIKDGGFRSVASGLTIHIREKMPDGSFRGVFVSDDRSPDESIQYTAEQGLLLENAAGAFLVMKDGYVIRENRTARSNNVVQFDTYAFDLNQLTGSTTVPFYKPRERTTLYLLSPDPDDSYLQRFPERMTAELHDRMTAPLYTFAFALIALAFLGRARTVRQDSNLAVAAVVALSLALRGAGFAVVGAASGSAAALALMYVVPLAGILFGALALFGRARLRTPDALQNMMDAAGGVVDRISDRVLPPQAGSP
ncbi:LPS export ABC transporter permease LptF [Propylenella binzhouense]|nr:LPS export ABC transporter permease LptF [Propylenella binzhouense]